MFGRPLSGRPLGGRPLGGRPLAFHDSNFTASGKGIAVPEIAVPYSAEFFTDGPYVINDATVTLGDATDYTGDAGYAVNSLGVYEAFIANAPRITDLGLLVEPAATNIFSRSRDTSQTVWTKTSVTPTAGQNSALDDTSATLITENGSGAILRRTSTSTVVSSSTYAVSLFLKRSNCDWVRVIVGNDTSNTNSVRVWLNLATGAIGTVDTTGTGYGYQSSSVETLTDGWYRLSIIVVAPSTGALLTMMSASADASTTRANIGSGAGVGTAYYFDQAQLQLGSKASSPLVSSASALTRAADALVLKLPDGTHNLVLTFDDDSIQTVTDQAGGDYAVPTNLDRPQVKSAVWGVV